MRLLTTAAVLEGEYPLRLRNVHGPEDVPYAILSHTWLPDEDEFVYEDIVQRSGLEKPGFTKVQNAMQQARQDGHDFIWIDTCCIDKSSSSELQEAINSMYRWYQNAKTCYAFLVDVCGDEDSYNPAKFVTSRWFKRGWTLQELLAPKNVLFFSADWSYLGNKVSLEARICRATRISPDVLLGNRSVESSSIAERMSWAAKRKTTRGEDRAYSLMGLFGTNMPVLYGEGALKAFHRLQEAIMRHNDDQTIFAWVDNGGFEDDHVHGLLADTPDAFGYDDVSNIEPRGSFSKVPHTMTNRGLRISVPLKRASGRQVFFALLGCHNVKSRHSDSRISILVLKLSDREQKYARFRCNVIYEHIWALSKFDQIFVSSVSTSLTQMAHRTLHMINFQALDWDVWFGNINDFALSEVEKSKLAVIKFSGVTTPKRPINGGSEKSPSENKNLFWQRGIAIRPGNVSAAFFLDRPVKYSFVVRMGFTSSEELVFDVVSLDKSSPKRPQYTDKEFGAHLSGSAVEVEGFSWKVNITTGERLGVKFYNVRVVTTKTPEHKKHSAFSKLFRSKTAKSLESTGPTFAQKVPPEMTDVSQEILSLKDGEVTEVSSLNSVVVYRTAEDEKLPL